MGLSWFLSIFPGPVLYLEKRSERRSIFAEHGQKLLWIAITAAVGTLVGSVLTILVQRWLK